MEQGDLAARLDELEIQTALQNELLDSLNSTVARLQKDLDLQQAQLRLLYGRLQEKDGAGGPNQPFNPAAEIPPHY
ncbi:SlyX family protein [Eikenella sp. S3360]|uniref:Protein SlyX homolog n=2 Tax=Eikenella glucosivorans TaxID=2766967 RepID=A0ABS0NCD4_9NEIS|nr:SlyX family protein [Eikenella glucosivorans]